MSHSRIHRYVIKEISTPTILSLLAFTFVLLMGRIPGIAELVINKRIPATEIFQLLAYLMPTFFSITVPLSFLLGILLAFGRFSAESEFIAFKASGISLYRLVIPVVAMAAMLVIVTGWITIVVEPASKSAFRNKLFQIASSNLSVSVKPGVFTDQFNGIVLYARGMNERLGIMQDVFISDERSGTTPATITAREGRFISDPDQFRLTLRLKDGKIHRHPTNEKQSTYQIISFTNYDINIDLGNPLDKKQNHYRKRFELSWAELNSAIENAKNGERKYRLQTEKYWRVVIAFAPLVLILVGVPLGLQSQRSGKGAGFTLALLVFLVYYVLLSFAETVGDKGILPAGIILWLPNVLFALGGAYFLHRTAVEKPLQIFTWPQRWRKQRQERKTGSGNKR